MRIWPGSASRGTSRCAGRASISTTTATRSRGWRRWASSIRASRVAPRSPRWWRRASATRRGRAIRTARRSIPVRRTRCRGPSAPGRIDAGEPYALRLDMAPPSRTSGALAFEETGAGPGDETGSVAVAPARWGDIVLARKETPTSYHLAVVVDDARQGVTHVVRGRDLFWSTSVHRLLQALLGLPTPVYHHHRLMLDDDGRKLSKSTAATGLRELRQRGVTPADIRRMIELEGG